MITNERILVFQDQQESHIRRVSSKGGDRVATITNLYFKNKHLSKHHATVKYEQDKGFTVEDTNSTFGTVINDTVIKHNTRHPLKDKDRLGLILSKPSSRIKDVFKKFESDLEHKSIPLLEFDSPKISMQFDVAIDKSVLKLVPSVAAVGANQGYDFTNEDSVTNLSTVEIIELENNDAEATDRSDDNESFRSHDEEKPPIIVIDLDEDSEENVGESSLKINKVAPSTSCKEITPNEDFDSKYHDDENVKVGIHEVLTAGHDSGETVVGNSSKLDANEDGLNHECSCFHPDGADTVSQYETRNEDDLARENGVVSKDESDGEDEPPSESDIVFEVSEPERYSNQKEGNVDEDAEIAVGSFHCNEAVSRSKCSSFGPNSTDIVNHREASQSGTPLAEEVSLVETTDDEEDRRDVTNKYEDGDVTSFENECSCDDFQNCKGAKKLSCNCDVEGCQNDSDHSCLSSVWDGLGDEYSPITLEDPYGEVESLCICSDPEDCYYGTPQIPHSHYQEDEQSKSGGNSYECLGCGSHTSSKWDEYDDSDSDSICVCSDPEDCYCGKKQTLFAPNKQRENVAKLVSINSSEVHRLEPYKDVSHLMEWQKTNSGISKLNGAITNQTLSNTRKRSHHDMVEEEELGSRVDGEDTSVGGDEDGKPPHKKLASEESKLKTICKEFAKGLFYVAATITALGVYGSTLEEN
ncbi:m [Candida margitis]|uniref:m n=1 Tax=Candida margitis TaxID=1775924 RepID=UPI00222726EB|nr:m [Candida margitis] [Candida margitis]KAI5969153.1 m [Candida margitis] [Candida margitis]